jgi:uncharacterized membrane protein YdjX (TVP38/TMEM64 family)
MSTKQILKISIFVLILGVIFYIKQFTPIGEQMTAENLRNLIGPMGFWGILLFIGLFSVGTIFQVPGWLFYSTAFMLFGSLKGGMIAYVGSVTAVVMSFYFARAIGGNMLAKIKNKRIQNILAKMDKNPVLIISFLRSFLWVSPPLNYALAFTNVSDRKYIIGSTIGLTVPAFIFALGYNYFF